MKENQNIEWKSYPNPISCRGVSLPELILESSGFWVNFFMNTHITPHDTPQDNKKVYFSGMQTRGETAETRVETIETRVETIETRGETVETREENTVETGEKIIFLVLENSSIAKN